MDDDVPPPMTGSTNTWRFERRAPRSCMSRLPSRVAVALLLFGTAPSQAQPASNDTLSVPITRPVLANREKDVDSNWNSLDCAAPKTHDEADLCEQRRMARTAEVALLPAWLQVTIGAAGFVFLFWNLLYVRRSTQAAIEAAATAQLATQIAADTAKKQLRAYMHIVSGEMVTGLHEHGFSIGYSIVMKNSGVTPAHINRAEASAAMHPYGTRAIGGGGMENRYLTVVPPGETYTIAFNGWTWPKPWEGDTEYRAQLASTSSTVYVGIKLQYDDGSGQTWTEDNWMEGVGIRKDSIPAKLPLRQCAPLRPLDWDNP